MNKEKQIEEMAEDLAGRDSCKHLPKNLCNNRKCSLCEAEILYEAGYRKQIEGEWTRFEVNGINYGQVYYQHKECKANETQLFPTPYNFCPNCGAHMRKEDEGK